jgi:hypothetical protein
MSENTQHTEQNPITVGDVINMLELHSRDLPLCISISNGQPCYLPKKVDCDYDTSADGLDFLAVMFK